MKVGKQRKRGMKHGKDDADKVRKNETVKKGEVDGRKTSRNIRKDYKGERKGAQKKINENKIRLGRNEWKRTKGKGVKEVRRK